MRLRTHVVVHMFPLVRRCNFAAAAGGCSPGYTQLLTYQKEQHVSDKPKEKVVGETSEVTPVGAKDGTLGAKDSVKRTVAKGGVAPTGAKDSAPVGAKDGTLGAKD
jgi:hypothetical protein